MTNEQISKISMDTDTEQTPTSIKAGQHFDAMSISEINPSTMAIKMDNRDNEITIRKDRNIPLMSDIYISVADQDNISAVNPLRYYIYKDVDVKEDADALASKEQSTQRSEIKELNASMTNKPKADNETVTTNSEEAKEGPKLMKPKRMQQRMALRMLSSRSSLILGAY